MKKFLTMTTAIILGTFLLTSCGKEDTNVSEDTKSKTEEKKEVTNKVTLNTVSMFGGTDPSAEDYKENIASFEAKNPGVIVDDVSSTSDEAWKASVQADYQVGSEPDVIFFFTGADAKPLIDTNSFVSVEEIRAEYPDYGSGVSEASMSFMVAEDGNSYAIPVRGFWEGLFVNEDLFNEYDLELPTTWENFMTAIEVFSQNDIVPVAASFADVPHYWIEHLILTMGGIEGHKADLKPGNIDQSWVDGLNLFRELEEAGAFSVDAIATNNDAISQLFRDKKAAMIVDGSWFAGGIEDKDTTIAMAFPSHPDGEKDPTDIVAGFSSGFYISRSAWENMDKKDAAVAFVQEMTSTESLTRFARVGGAPAGPIEAPTGLTNLEVTGLEFSSEAKGADMPVDSRLDKEAWNYMVSNISNIVDGTLTAEEVLERAAELNK